MALGWLSRYMEPVSFCTYGQRPPLVRHSWPIGLMIYCVTWADFATLRKARQSTDDVEANWTPAQPVEGPRGFDVVSIAVRSTTNVVACLLPRVRLPARGSAMRGRAPD